MINWHEKLIEVREHIFKPINDYVDRHDTAGDLTQLNAEYTPQQYRQLVSDGIATIDELISNLAGETDSST